MGYTDPEHRIVSEQSLGKGLRSSLLLLTIEASGGDWKSAIMAGVALEAFHNGTLIHDDIQDNDIVRHSIPTVWKVLGIPQAINIGDAAFFFSNHALQELAQWGYSKEQCYEASRMVTRTGSAVVDGQIRDIDFEERTVVSPDEYQEMVDRKTGALLETSIMLGAYLGRLPVEKSKFLRTYAQKAGRAFQMSDDVLGIWGDSEKTGKPVGSDIRARKQSLPIVLALNSNHALVPEMLAIYAQKKDELDDSDVERVTRILNEMGIKEQMTESLEKLRDEGLNALDQVDFEGWAKRDFAWLMEKLVDREK